MMHTVVVLAAMFTMNGAYANCAVDGVGTHFAIQFFDETHSSDEDRFPMPGMSSGAKLLVVCQYEREDGEIIRIVSAHMATRRESTFHQGGQTRKPNTTSPS